MYVLIGKIEMFLPGSHSLKEKRMTVRSVTEKLKNRFRASVAEVAEQDKWQRLVIGIAVTGGEFSFLDALEDQIIRMIEENFDLEITNHDFEIIKK